VLSNLYYAKAAFGCGFGWQSTPLVELLAFGKSKSRKKPNQRRPKSENKPAPKMVQKWVPKIATLAKSIDSK
jgi:hypothetical protein